MRKINKQKHQRNNKNERGGGRNFCVANMLLWLVIFYQRKQKMNLRKLTSSDFTEKLAL